MENISDDVLSGMSTFYVMKYFESKFKIISLEIQISLYIIEKKYFKSSTLFWPDSLFSEEKMSPNLKAVG